MKSAKRFLGKALRDEGDPAPSRSAPTLSMVVPVYNEIRTLKRMLLEVTRALPLVSKQIVIVDDGSSDGTSEWPRGNLAHAEGVWRRMSLDDDGKPELSVEGPQNEAGFSFTVLFHERNRGKGAAVRTGFAYASGDVIVVRDADLEYDPHDWSRMFSLIADRKIADVVYGSRFYGRPHRSLSTIITWQIGCSRFLFNVLYNQMMSDVQGCYNMFTKDVLNSLTLTSDKYGFEIEISAQIARARRWRIYEVGISYYGRTYAEGKKIDWLDAVKAPR
jgi:glycosyltransferase involved in cell wall biosynthesis